MTKNIQKITVRTDVLASVAKWAHADASRPIGSVAFRADNTIVATDAHRLVIVPCETFGHAFGVTRAHLLAAIAAQDVIARDGLEPQVGHDHADDNGQLSDGPYGDREITLWPDGTRAIIDLGAIAVRVPRIDIKEYPNVESALQGEDVGTPDGYLVDPKFLVAIDEINAATSDHRHGVRIKRWSRLGKDGTRGPLIMKNSAGVTFAIMPQRDKENT